MCSVRSAGILAEGTPSGLAASVNSLLGRRVCSSLGVRTAVADRLDRAVENGGGFREASSPS
jgi:hypothetical protein